MIRRNGTTEHGIPFRTGSYLGKRNNNTREVTYQTPDGDLTVYYSYDTVIAFRDPAELGLVASENVWSVTTARHLSQAGSRDKKSRLPREEFRARIRDLDARYNLHLAYAGTSY